MTDDDSIVVACGDSAAEALAVFGFEVFGRGHQDVGTGVELQILRSPLLRQMIRHNDQAFLAETQPFAFLCQRHHGIGLACADHMAKQLISAIQPAGNSVELVLPQGYFRIDAGETQMTAVILAWTD